MVFSPHFWLRGLLLILVGPVLLAPSLAAAVIISYSDGTANTSLPSFSGWDYVGELNGSSGVYLGDGWVITADHVGPGDFTLDSVVYPWIPGSEQTFDNGGGPSTPDLLMFQLSIYPNLPLLPLRSSVPLLGEFSLVIGGGRDRDAPTSYDPNGPEPPDPLDGWGWLPTRTKRWGTNEIDGFPVGLVLGTVAVFTSFDEAGHIFEAQAADGDSGGALFTAGPPSELAGIVYAIGPANGQPAGTSLFTNLTFAARIDFYHDQIQDVLALPEPTGALPWGIGLLAMLQRRRSRATAADRAA